MPDHLFCCCYICYNAKSYITCYSLSCSLPEAELGLPDLVGGESYEWAAIDNLDAFFTRIYRCTGAFVCGSGVCNAV
jgi:hypothetical protein